MVAILLLLLISYDKAIMVIWAKIEFRASVLLLMFGRYGKYASNGMISCKVRSFFRVLKVKHFSFSISINGLNC
jgi:hypothetical protein